MSGAAAIQTLLALFLLCNSVLQKKSQEVSPKRQAAQEDLVGATLEYIQGMGIVKSFNLGGKSNQKMKQAIEESRARNTKLETVFGPYGMVQLFVLRLASVAIMFCSMSVIFIARYRKMVQRYV